MLVPNGCGAHVRQRWACRRLTPALPRCRYSVPQLGSNTVPLWMSTGTLDPIMRVGMQEAIVASVAAVRTSSVFRPQGCPRSNAQQRLVYYNASCMRTQHMHLCVRA